MSARGKRVVNLEDGEIDVMCGLYLYRRNEKNSQEFTEPFSDDNVTIFVWHDRAFPFETWRIYRGKSSVFVEHRGDRNLRNGENRCIMPKLNMSAITF